MSQSSLPAIYAEQLSIGFGKNLLLRNIDASIQLGEFIAILGPNGCGKTTLLKTLLGAMKPIQGVLKVLGHSPHQDCHSIGYMPQQFLHPALKHLTARTLLTAAIQAYQWGLPYLTRRQRREIDRVLSAVEAESFADYALDDCSGGQKRRIMLAQALLGAPKLLLLDEPLANLDLRHQEKFVEILSRLKEELQVTVLLTSHDMNPLMQAISRVWYLAEKQAVLGPFNEVVTTEKLSALYQTPIEVIRHKDRYFVMGIAGGSDEFS